MHQTLSRECIEEINAAVEIGNLLFVREYIGKNHEHAAFDSELHQMEYMFLCDVKSNNSEIRNGSVPDDGQVGIEWLPLTDLLNYRLYPQTLREKIMAYESGKAFSVYLGDIN